MSDIFISYAKEDRDRARVLAQALETGGFSVWWDRNILAGQIFDEVIERELETAKTVVVLWSKHSVVSEWVKNEAQVAAERGTLVPALIDNVRLPLQFRRKQTADMVGWDGNLAHLGFETLRQGILAHVTRQLPVQLPDTSLPEANRIVDADSIPCPIETDTPAQAEKPIRAYARNPSVRAGTIALLIVAVVGVGFWDAYYRPYTENYTSVSMARGIPEGVGPLTTEQLRQRNITLAFLKQGRWGQIIEIRAVNSRGAYPPEFAYFPPMSLLDLNPLLADESEMTSTCRVTFTYENGRIVTQNAYNRSDRLIYTLNYPQSDHAEYRWGLYHKVVSESGITHIRIVTPASGPEAGLHTDRLFQDSNGTPRPDDKGSFGERRLFNKQGLPVENISLNQNGRPVPNRLDIAKTVMEYDELGNLTKVKYLGSDGRPIAGQSGSAEQKIRYDQHGNLIEIAFFGVEGQLVTSQKMRAAGRTWAYDSQGNLIQYTWFGPDRQLVTGPFGIAKQEIVWNEKGGSTETSFGPDGKPVLFERRFFKVRGDWDNRGYVVQAAFLDENERPVRNSQGCAKTRMGRDQQGNVTDLTCLDEGDQAIRDTRGFARVKMKYDPRGNKLEEAYFRPDDQPEFYEETFVKTRWKYNPQDKPTEMTNFDAADKLVRTRDGFASITYTYDSAGNTREIAFFDETGRPTARKGGYAKIVWAYDARKNLIEETLLNTDGKSARGEDGYAKARFKYDARGYRVETKYYDEHDLPAANEEGCAKVANQYNVRGQWTEWACFGANGSPTLAKKYGNAKTSRMFDTRGNISQIDFFDANDIRVQSANGYARIRYLYDELGRETKREFFDVAGVPVLTRVTIQKVEPQSKSQRVGLQQGDIIISYDGLEVADDRRFEELELTAGESQRQLTVEREGRFLSLNLPAGRLRGLETLNKASSKRETNRRG